MTNYRMSGTLLRPQRLFTVLCLVWVVTACSGEVTGRASGRTTGGTSGAVASGGNEPGGGGLLGAGGIAQGSGGLSTAGGTTGGVGTEATGGESTCPTDQWLCGALCYDLQSSLANCGACGRTCPALAFCQFGNCVCSQGLLCGEFCADTTSDPLNCGGCGIQCPDGGRCSAGTCVDDAGSAGGAGGNGGTGVTGGTAGTAGRGGAAPAPPSCPGAAPGCGSSSESCCTSIFLEGGGFLMGRSAAGADAYAGSVSGDPVQQDNSGSEQPEHYVTVSPFYLDKYEVTVGRVRQFVLAYDEWRRDGYPTQAQGANPHLPGSGWQSGWPLPPDSAALGASFDCFPNWSTWTKGNDNYPINCVDWYRAFAFCIWDGGRLPTEAEWEFAAAGGDDNRLYPWGPEAPDCTRASYTDCADFYAAPFTVVGSYPAGNSRWGHADLAGSMWEWVLDQYQADWYSTGGSSCSDCANLTTGLSQRVLRSGGWNLYAYELRAAYRGGHAETDQSGITGGFGFRCARNVL